MTKILIQKDYDPYRQTNGKKLTCVPSKTSPRGETVQIVNPGHEEAFGLWMVEQGHL